MLSGRHKPLPRAQGAPARGAGGPLAVARRCNVVVRCWCQWLSHIPKFLIDKDKSKYHAPATCLSKAKDGCELVYGQRRGGVGALQWAIH